MTAESTFIHINEVGPRDGLQREQTFIPTEQKIAMIDRLSESGLKRIQVTSFVHPKYVPQMADAEAVYRGIIKHPDVTYTGLALNMKGLERAADAGLNHVDLSYSSSDSHGRKNTNKSLPEAQENFAKMVEKAREYGMEIDGGIHCAFGYYVDDVTPELVIDIAQKHLALGVDALRIADSTGMANPRQIKELLGEIIALAGDVPVILHLHDTRGMGLANVVAALEVGCRHFDTAFGGLGGCNFIESAAGNIATEDTLNMLHAIGYETGVDVAQVAEVSRMLQGIIGQILPGKLYKLVEPNL